MSVATIKSDPGEVTLRIRGVRTRGDRELARVELALAAMRLGAEILPEHCDDQLIRRSLERQQKGEG